MKTFEITIHGQVQGIGFRPHVYLLAREMSLNGTVSNEKNGVHIHVTGIEEDIHGFYQKLIQNPIPSAIIQDSNMVEKELELFNDFRIVDDPKDVKPDVLITPDLGICSKCEQELEDHSDRRFSYSFTTCTHCGPRYSIIRELPYDRPRTAMDKFRMCPTCLKEYDTITDRRFYSQTNSCADCGIEMRLLDRDGRSLPGNQQHLVDHTAELIRKGNIVAVKGIGGFLLMADATSRYAIQTLRKRKNRPSKPLALLYPDEKTLKEDVEASDKQLQTWNSIESPIVLFKVKQSSNLNETLEWIAPGLNEIGAMRPYAPLLYQIISKVGKPVIATSGNMSGSPIQFVNDSAKEVLKDVADYFLINDREIVTPQDDSVFKITHKHSKQIVLRRSRGYAPNLVMRNGIQLQQNTLAMGALLKSTFTVHTNRKTYVSQYLGNSMNFDVQQTFRQTIDHLSGLLEFEPKKVLVDQHPDYFSTQLGLDMADKKSMATESIQHHKAHFAAVLAENGLINVTEPVLGIVWDGVGLGDDGQVWGGEFFSFLNNQIDRIDHFEYFQNLAGDKMAMEPRLSAMSIVGSEPEAQQLLKGMFTDEEWKVYQKMLDQKSGVVSSSVGRLFDAASAILGICEKQTFEGEAAMYLESAAQRKYEQDSEFSPYDVDALSAKEIMIEMIKDLKDQHAETVAFRFHCTLAELVFQIASKQGFQKVAFSGGVFQNGLLVDLIIDRLDQQFDLYFHRQLSPNDENISFGQLAYYSIIEKQRLNEINKVELIEN